MAYLFKDIVDLKKVVGGALNNSMEITSMDPFIERAYKSHIAIWLGAEQWDELIEKFNDDSLSPEQEQLLPFLQKPL